jgi:hypothetical protein
MEGENIVLVDVKMHQDSCIELVLGVCPVELVACGYWKERNVGDALRVGLQKMTNKE